MSRGLAIETSGRIGSVALVDGGSVVSSQDFPHGLKHAAELVPRIDHMCRERGWQPRDLRELYVSAGPGSFTGLRIGVTLAKALAFATGARIVAVPTVRVLVHNAPPEARHVVLVLDAKRDQIFTARFSRSGDHWVEEEPAHLDSLSAMLARAPRPVYLVGEGIPFHQQFIPADDAAIRITAPNEWQARAEAVAREGVRLAAEGSFVDPDRFAPVYIRRPEAEEKLEARQRA